MSPEQPHRIRVFLKKSSENQTGEVCPEKDHEIEMAITHKFTLMCDDVRREDNGKLLLIGVYQDTDPRPTVSNDDGTHIFH